MVPYSKAPSSDQTRGKRDPAIFQWRFRRRFPGGRPEPGPASSCAERNRVSRFLASGVARRRRAEEPTDGGLMSFARGRVAPHHWVPGPGGRPLRGDAFSGEGDGMRRNSVHSVHEALSWRDRKGRGPGPPQDADTVHGLWPCCHPVMAVNARTPGRFPNCRLIPGGSGLKWCCCAGVGWAEI